jgi:hypothetical protein
MTGALLATMNVSRVIARISGHSNLRETSKLNTLKKKSDARGDSSMSTFKEARAIMAHKLWRALGWAVWVTIIGAILLVILIGGILLCEIH